MSKHTPGPWIATVQPGQVVGVHTYTHQVMYGDDCIASLLTKADAHLIAAAPDLLEVAKSLLDAQRYAKSIRDYHEALDNAKHLARAAIAKAEGGEK